MPAALFISGPCKVCEQPAHGNHFGVLSCRACAAFFRRAASRSIKYLELACDNGNCAIFENDKYHCKKCRLKKCYSVGMDQNKFKPNHDLISSTTSSRTSKSASPMSIANFLGRPEFILCCEPDKGAKVKTLIDVSHLIRQATQLFQCTNKNDFCGPWMFESSLEQLTVAVDNIKTRRIAKQKQFELIKSIGIKENMMFWEQTFLSAAQWFAEIPEFQELDLETKIAILKSTWMVWARLEKTAESVDYQKRKLLKSGVYIWTDDTCMDLTDVTIDVEWYTNYSMGQLRAFLEPDIHNHLHCFNDVFRLNPSTTELNFMLMQLCLNEAGKRHQGRILEITDRLLQSQADNLHDYYTKTLKMPHYSGRLAQLMKVNKRIEQDVRQRRERNHLSCVFNLYSVEWSNPEMFECA